MERKTPAACEQEKAEKLVSVCREILLNARNELYLNLRFMDAALSSLNFVPDFTAEGAGTDGYHYTYQPDFLAGRFMSGRVLVNRLYFHSVLHCVFVHMDTRGKREEGLWNLACDIAVEYLIDSMDMKCLHRPQTPARRECYLRLKEKTGVMNAQSIYRCLQEEKLPEGRYLALMAEFYADNHSYWTDENDRPRMASDRKNKWDGMRETMETEMETFSKKASDEAGELSRQVRIENREQYDYREFLRKFSVMRETVQIDTDAFDYIYYDYGLRTYGNMPLIEPLETKEVKKIEEFAVVIDTSMSCSAEFFLTDQRQPFGLRFGLEYCCQTLLKLITMFKIMLTLDQLFTTQDFAQTPPEFRFDRPHAQITAVLRPVNIIIMCRAPERLTTCSLTAPQAADAGCLQTQ